MSDREAVNVSEHEMQVEAARALLLETGLVHEQLDRFNDAELLMHAKRLPKQKCCFCGERFRGWGNNPAPILEKGVACRACNVTIVLPQRFRNVKREESNLGQ